MHFYRHHVSATVSCFFFYAIKIFAIFALFTSNELERCRTEIDFNCFNLYLHCLGNMRIKVANWYSS